MGNSSYIFNHDLLTFRGGVKRSERILFSWLLRKGEKNINITENTVTNSGSQLTEWVFV